MITKSKLRPAVGRAITMALVAAGVSGAMALGTGVAFASDGYYGDVHHDNSGWSYNYRGHRYHGDDRCSAIRSSFHDYEGSSYWSEVDSDSRRGCGNH